MRVRLTLVGPGPRVLRFTIAPLDDEQVTRNNVREALVTVRDRRERCSTSKASPASR